MSEQSVFCCHFPCAVVVAIRNVICCNTWAMLGRCVYGSSGGGVGGGGNYMWSLFVGMNENPLTNLINFYVPYDEMRFTSTRVVYHTTAFLAAILYDADAAIAPATAIVHPPAKCLDCHHRHRFTFDLIACIWWCLYTCLCFLVVCFSNILLISYRTTCWWR